MHRSGRVHRGARWRLAQASRPQCVHVTLQDDPQPMRNRSKRMKSSADQSCLVTRKLKQPAASAEVLVHAPAAALLAAPVERALDERLLAALVVAVTLQDDLQPRHSRSKRMMSSADQSCLVTRKLKQPAPSPEVMLAAIE